MLKQHGHEVDRSWSNDGPTPWAWPPPSTSRSATPSACTRSWTRSVFAMAWQVFVQVDSGGVPVGKLVRPKRDRKDKTQELTKVRRLPKGRRPKSKREVRVVVAWLPGQVVDKIVDLHIAPLKHPEITGQDMYIAALEAGMGDNTHVHCTCDMAQWQILQFDEQFGAQPTATLCADFYHTLEYAAAAGRAIEPAPNKIQGWIAMQARRLKEGDLGAILGDFVRTAAHGVHAPRMIKIVAAPNRYLTRNGEHMDYPRFIAEELPIGSGGVEGRIRHIVRRRLDVPGDWREPCAPHGAAHHPSLGLVGRILGLARRATGSASSDAYSGRDSTASAGLASRACQRHRTLRTR